MTTVALTIAGSDPSGGAGIQADLKTFSALGAYGMSVITALTAQSTQGVDAVLPVSPEFVEAQFNTLYQDINIDSVKMGMLMNKEIVTVVHHLLKKHPIANIVLDTVMVAKGGHPLLKSDAVNAIRELLLPLATVITPNLPEAAALLDCQEAQNEDEMQAQGHALLKLGCKAVLIKGGHLLSQESPDYLITPNQTIRMVSPRIQTKNTHGTGCTLSAAITALLPQHSLPDAIQQAKNYLQGAISHADDLSIGKGIGPTHHFYQWW
ncbi:MULTISPECIES: bifunctional hydroxymethylpyrimidine kinase/phosphomethylpyrimidine kinase [unclassified Gilliamella]|uniref:bifunctional hydroxymethylpyrimidine kinase/phosphomethylpyrimidine kinase n=1 Tax=unclassified Gilliamella TaxID=2685620 RepID=UPI002269BA51|nr:MULTISPECIES: bifunctional hydroxymethylpyrimidine kinase/phosphomethylpyrimidine kinase [unclassified Gilliamella]MCX8641490.1 bifunctional hydroxymethylpyrimidine kinase/phosphomethylpyrimidine kinase [Gilliamella sp. B3835]MCX8707600.1 bifunctional hydroxymethylpyrimidine kinase/phosphomethylpyrimidine kinase [Gilliamella sp. B3783]MCX8710680.1 bifunctional hydroxymethylpyrimidine kinase/phosphomethylpyrimidine kinase [Gilliamella sp. B3780]MCX8711147.1 bifunctional hydroxymethylpyrimidin